jgi:hypothetical protein
MKERKKERMNVRRNIVIDISIIFQRILFCYEIDILIDRMNEIKKYRTLL